MAARRLKVYMAGKITKNGWRHELVGGLRMPMDDATGNWQSLSAKFRGSVRGGHDYVGPYFVCCGHGPTSHGQGTVQNTDRLYANDNDCPDAVDRSPGQFHNQVLSSCMSLGTLRQYVFAECSHALRHADVVFAWVDSTDCFGTLVELGQAHAFRLAASAPQIWIASPRLLPEMWFGYQTADKVLLGAMGVIDAWDCITQDRQPDGRKWGPWHFDLRNWGSDDVARLVTKRLSPEYRSYVESKEWHIRRATAIRHAGNQCQRCGSGGTLYVHHRTYERLGREDTADLEVLCEACHAQADQERDARAAQEHWQKRVVGWARKRYGDDWDNNRSFDAVSDEFKRCLCRKRLQ